MHRQKNGFDGAVPNGLIMQSELGKITELRRIACLERPLKNTEGNPRTKAVLKYHLNKDFSDKRNQG